jgi:hypothetical protein
LQGHSKKAILGDSWYTEYKIKNENELRYQALPQMNEDKLKQHIDIYSVQMHDILDGSYFFFDALFADIESIRVIDSTM